MVTVVTSLDTGFSVAVIVVDPPSSSMLVGDKFNVKMPLGGESSSKIVRVTSSGSSTFDELVVPETVISFLSGPYVSLSIAVIVTKPVLLVCPAGIVKMVFILNV